VSWYSWVTDVAITDGIPFGYYGCDVYHLGGVCLLYTDVFSLSAGTDVFSKALQNFQFFFDFYSFD
jgi:hypothetical protein